jgi:outer membrane protein OmpA-like peptidoglycan-associated protein
MMLGWVVPAALAHGGVSGIDAHGLVLATGSGEPRARVAFVRPGDLDGLGWSLGGDGGDPSRTVALGHEGWTALDAGVGTGTKRRRDADGDGFSNRDDACPDGAETKNGYRDDDGCPDAIPQLEFVAKRGETDEPGAALTVVRVGDAGPPMVGMGRVVATGMPGTAYAATAKIGACFGGTAEGQVPAEGSLAVQLQIGRQDAQLTVSVTDAIGRPLEGAEARYLVEDDACAPIDTRVKNGRGTHVIGAGPVTVFLTAPGYGVHQESLTLTPGQMELVEARLAPTQVALRDSVFQLARPLQFGSGTAILGASSTALLGQVASLMRSNEGQKFQITAYAPAGADSKRLSQERAATVVRQLVALGVPEDALVGVGRGALPSRQREYVTIKVNTD